MNRTAELLTEALAHLDNNREARDALPFLARNLIATAYNVMIDIQVDGLSGTEAYDLIDVATDNITAYVIANANGIDSALAEQIHFLVKPINALCAHLNCVQSEA